MTLMAETVSFLHVLCTVHVLTIKMNEKQPELERTCELMCV